VRPAGAMPAPTYRAIIARRAFWGAALGHFCSNYSFYFVVSWLPLYLVKERSFSMGQMAAAGGLIYGVYAASSLTAGWLTDRWMKAGASDTLARKTAIIASHVIPAASLLVAAFGDATTAIVALCVAAVGFGINTSQLFSIGQTLAGPRAGGKWMGFQNCVGNVAGIVGPVVTGFVVEASGNFTSAFVIASLVGLGGVVAWGLVIRKVAPLEW